MKEGKRIKYLPISLGCVKNLVDMEYLAGALRERGWEIAESADEADCAVINTCAFINDAEKESEEVIREFENRMPVIVTGCLPQRFGSSVEGMFPKVKVFTGTESALFSDWITGMKGRAVKTNHSGKYREQEARELFTRFHSYIKLSEGCGRACSFCLIPSIRGKFRSRRMKNIIAEIYALYEAGITEFNLVSEDTSLYGTDLYGKRSVHELLKKIEKDAPEDSLFRVLYYFPDKTVYETADIISESGKFIKYIDVPMQHVSEEIIRGMNRPYEDPYRIAEHIRKRGLILRTSLMTGFPGETEKEFEKMVEFVKSGLIDRLGVFTFSAVKSVPASSMRGKVDEDTALMRADILIKEQRKHALKKMKAHIGKVYDAVYEGSTDGKAHIRLIEDMPEGDNRAFSRGIVIGSAPGERLRVKVWRIVNYEYEVKILDNSK